MTELKSSDLLAEPLIPDAVITDGQWHRIGLIWDGSNGFEYYNASSSPSEDGVGIKQHIVLL